MRDAAELDRDVHLAPQIAAEKDDAHAATSQLADEVVSVPYKATGSTLDHRATVTSPYFGRDRSAHRAPRSDRDLSRRRADADPGAHRAHRSRARAAARVA